MSTIKQELEFLLKQLEAQPGGASSSKSHLKMALYDWNKEKQWGKPNAFVLTDSSRGYIFFTFSKTEPRWCSFRHLFVLEPYRKDNIGTFLIKRMKEEMIGHNIIYLRFYANKPAITFYERLGYKWMGENKQGLPFTFTNIETNELVYDERQMKRLYKIYNKNLKEIL